MSWEMRRIGDVCDVIPGFAFRSKDLGETGIPVVKIGNITDDYRVDIESVQHLPADLVSQKHEKFTLTNGDTLIAMTGATAGKVGRICCSEDQVLLLNQRVAKFKPRTINPDFLWSAISTPRYRTIFYGLGGGAAQPNMSGAQIESVEIPFPPLPVQEHIASILSAYDDLIENNRRRIQLLEQAARLLYKEWFVRLRFPGHEHVTITDGVPEGWEKKPVVDVWDISYGKNLPTKHITSTGKYPVHGADGIIGYHTEKNVDSSLCLVTCRGNGSGNVRRTFGPTFVTNNCFVLRPNHKADELKFHYAIMAMEFLPLRELRTGAAQPQLTLAGINHLQVIVPSSSILILYNSLADPLFDQADCLRKQNDQLAQARDLLLPRLMNGELAV